ncbi:MAG TPA: PQQ-binding-like beta-propeller repeat protein [Planctomycetota bacterium]|nr:PQQ-binding-like beta-propeller repeat protein [Planctomycetota bacterium]
MLVVLLPSRDADAVIPSAFGPIQALIVILPQLLLALAGLLLAIFKPRTYKLLGAYLWSHKVFTAVLVAGIVLLIWGPSFSSGTVAEEQVGAAWSAFRGGPGRSGSVAGSKGPQGQPRILWKLAGDPLGGSSAEVDSSPAVVGNRVYFGVGTNSLLSGSRGSICCVDADTGALAWRWTGDKELPTPLRAIFSSPVIAVEAPEKGAPPAARYLVSGEGYHEDKDGRLICLDLEPVRRSKGKEPPKLVWFLQATDHVEATPCIHEGKVFVGAGDDGYWCVELATGKVLWHLEGSCDTYELKGPKATEVGALEGKKVAVSGVVKRVGAGARTKDDPGTMTIEVASFREVTAPPIPLMESGRSLDRTVVGKVEKDAKGVRLILEFFNPDSESSPVGATLETKEQRLIFGSGVAGERVNCVNAETGALIWKAPVKYPAFGAPTVYKDKVLIGVGEGDFVHSAQDPIGVIHCLSLKDGSKLWETKLADTVLGAITVMDGQAYACSRDGNVYVLDVEKGTILTKYPTGSPIVSSPAVTTDAIYVGNDGGRLFCIDRKSGKIRFTTPVSPGSPIVSSPAVAAGKLFIGTRNKGMLCLADPPADAEKKVVLQPADAVAGRTGCADDRGLPAVNGDTSDLKWPTSDGWKAAVKGGLSLQGHSILVPFESGAALVDPVTGHTEKAGAAPAAKDEAAARIHGLRFRVVDGELRCASDDDKVLLWRVAPETPITNVPTVAGDRVFITTAGKDKAKAFIEGRKLVDGSLAWRRELDDAPLSPVVAAGDWCAVATADEKIAVFGSSGGKLREPLPVGGKPVAPALCGDVVIVAGENRIAAHDLSSSEWIWNYKDQDNIGMVSGQPIILGETIWVGTAKRGLVAIGIPQAQAKK